MVNVLQHALSVDLSFENGVRWEIQDSEDRASAGLFPLSFFIPSIAYVSTKKNVFPEILLFDNPFLGDLTLEGPWRS